MIVVPGEPEPKPRNSLLSTAYFQRYMVDRLNTILESRARYDGWQRVRKLRESCGMPPTQVTVSVRLPSRYAKD